VSFIIVKIFAEYLLKLIWNLPFFDATLFTVSRAMHGFHYSQKCFFFTRHEVYETIIIPVNQNSAAARIKCVKY